jgi:hypothetical protein
VALDRKGEVVGAHAVPVVDDADEPASAGFHRDLDRSGARINRVLDQFLHGRGRALHHLARGDAVDENGIEAADMGHAPSAPKGAGTGSRRRAWVMAEI